jgi:hypothetical protein
MVAVGTAVAVGGILTLLRPSAGSETLQMSPIGDTTDSDKPKTTPSNDDIAGTKPVENDTHREPLTENQVREAAIDANRRRLQQLREAQRVAEVEQRSHDAAVAEADQIRTAAQQQQAESARKAAMTANRHHLTELRATQAAQEKEALHLAAEAAERQRAVDEETKRHHDEIRDAAIARMRERWHELQDEHHAVQIEQCQRDAEEVARQRDVNNAEQQRLELARDAAIDGLRKRQHELHTAKEADRAIRERDAAEAAARAAQTREDEQRRDEEIQNRAIEGLRDRWHKLHEMKRAALATSAMVDVKAQQERAAVEAENERQLKLARDEAVRGMRRQWQKLQQGHLEEQAESDRRNAMAETERQQRDTELEAARDAAIERLKQRQDELHQAQQDDKVEATRRRVEDEERLRAQRRIERQQEEDAQKAAIVGFRQRWQELQKIARDEHAKQREQTATELAAVGDQRQRCQREDEQTARREEEVRDAAIAGSRKRWLELQSAARVQREADRRREAEELEQQRQAESDETARRNAARDAAIDELRARQHELEEIRRAEQANEVRRLAQQQLELEAERNRQEAIRDVAIDTLKQRWKELRLATAEEIPTAANSAEQQVDPTEATARALNLELEATRDKVIEGMKLRWHEMQEANTAARADTRRREAEAIAEQAEADRRLEAARNAAIERLQHRQLELREERAAAAAKEEHRVATDLARQRAITEKEQQGADAAREAAIASMRLRWQELNAVKKAEAAAARCADANVRLQREKEELESARNEAIESMMQWQEVLEGSAAPEVQLWQASKPNADETESAQGDSSGSD